MKMLPTLFTALSLVSLPGGALADALKGTLYKDQHCECCEAHAEYLRKNGFELEIKPVENLVDMSIAAGVPPGFQGCHLITLNGYVFEGHITGEIIKKFLAEKPRQLVGLSIPGMPAGVPGMQGPKEGPIIVYGVNNDETTTVYAAR